MLLVKQCRSGDFCKACLHILRSVVRPLASPLTQASAGGNPAGRQTHVSWQVSRMQAGLPGQAGKWLSVCMWTTVQTSLQEQPAKPMLQALKASGVQSADRFMTDACISVFRLPTDQNRKSLPKERGPCSLLCSCFILQYQESSS